MSRLRFPLRVAAGLAVLTVPALAGPTFGAFTATVTDTANSAGTAAALLTAKDSGNVTQCATAPGSTVGGAQTIACSGSTLPAAVATSGTAAATTTLQSTGGTSPTVATYTASSCAPVALANGVAAGDPMLARGGVTYAQSGPLTGSASLGLDGTSALATDISAITPSATLTEGIWFKVAGGYAAGGTLLGFGSSPSAVSDTTADKTLALTGGGKVSFTISTTLGNSTLTSASAYNDGGWHFAAATVTTTLGVTAAALYVDGVSAGSGSGLTLLTGYAGYWHAGWSPASGYLTGNVADAFVVNGTALTAAQIATLDGVSTQTSWATTVASDGATASWPLGDAGTGTYSGTLPLIGSTDPCTMIAVSVGSAAWCLYSPNSSSPCATPTGSSATLSAWVAAGALAFPATASGASTAIATTVIRASSYNATFMPGLRLALPVTLTERVGTTGWYSTFTWASTAQQVTA